MWPQIGCSGTIDQLLAYKHSILQLTSGVTCQAACMSCIRRLLHLPRCSETRQVRRCQAGPMDVQLRKGAGHVPTIMLDAMAVGMLSLTQWLCRRAAAGKHSDHGGRGGAGWQATHSAAGPGEIAGRARGATLTNAHDRLTLSPLLPHQVCMMHPLLSLLSTPCKR